MNTKLFYLPCFVYAFSFFLILLIYELGWSDLYPQLEGSLLFFLIITISFSFCCSIIQKFKLRDKRSAPGISDSFVKKSLYFLLFGYLLEFAYEGGVPLVSTLLSASFSYKDFTGIPTFHVILSTYNIFFSILIFEYYITNRSFTKILYFVLSMIPFVLVMNRGAFMIVFSALLFVFLMKTKSIGMKVLFRLFGVFLFIFFMFGVIGNIRQEQTKEDKDYLLRIGGASDKFINSGIPAEYYWSYIYIISPIGNLQNLMVEKESVFELSKLPQFISTQLLPDFLSKRVTTYVVPEKDLEDDGSGDYLVTPLLNAPTTFYASYLYLGYGGLIIMYLVILFSSIIYPILLPSSSSYYVTAIASLNSIILLSTFNNMWYATGTILFWPLIMHGIKRIKV